MMIVILIASVIGITIEVLKENTAEMDKTSHIPNRYLRYIDENGLGLEVQNLNDFYTRAPVFPSVNSKIIRPKFSGTVIDVIMDYTTDNTTEDTDAVVITVKVEPVVKPQATWR